MAESPIGITDQLREWARGMYTTEVLIRARNGTLASIERPWIKPGDQWLLDRLPGHHRTPPRPLRRRRTAAADRRLHRLDQATPVRLGDVLSGLDRPTLRLVLAAVAHAGASHQHSSPVIDRDGNATITKQPSLFIWDGEARLLHW